MIPYLNHTRLNPWVEKFLIGLQGWSQYTDKAIRMLNVYYDYCDWQLNAEFSSTIHVTGDTFTIDYLIDNPKSHQQTLIYCLHAPAFDPSLAIEVFSWHTPHLVEYIYDDISYVWAQL